MKIQKAKDMVYGEDYFVNALLLGDAGQGKTTSAATWPADFKILLIDIDQGKEALYGYENVYIITIDTQKAAPSPWNEIVTVKNKLATWLRKGIMPFDVVIVDSVTRMYELAMDYALIVDPQTYKGNPLRDHYTIAKRECTQVLDWMIGAKFHLVCTCHEKVLEDKTLGSIKIVPAIIGQDAPRLPRRLREVYQCVAMPGKGVNALPTYRWETSATPYRSHISSNLNQHGKVWKESQIPPSFEWVFKKCGIKLEARNMPIPEDKPLNKGKDKTCQEENVKKDKEHVKETQQTNATNNQTNQIVTKRKPLKKESKNAKYV